MKFHRDPTSRNGHIWVTRRNQYGITLGGGDCFVCVMYRMPRTRQKLGLVMEKLELEKPMLAPFVIQELMMALRPIPNVLRCTPEVKRIVESLADKLTGDRLYALVTTRSMAAYMLGDIGRSKKAELKVIARRLRRHLEQYLKDPTNNLKDRIGNDLTWYKAVREEKRP